jgi:hypothetical protein
MTKTVTIGQFLTAEEIKTATELYATCRPGTFASVLTENVILPNIERINKALGQENDARYLAYMVEYALMATKHNPTTH